MNRNKRFAYIIVALMMCPIGRSLAKEPSWIKDMLKDDKGGRKLIEAAQKGETAKIAELLPKTATIVARVYALEMSEKKGFKQISDAILASGLSTAAEKGKNSAGRTALMYAAQCGKVGALKALARSGANIDQQMAARRVKVMTFTSENASSRSSSSSPSQGDGNNALSLAILAREYECVGALVELGADVNRMVVYADGYIASPSGNPMFMNARDFYEVPEKEATIIDLAKLTEDARIISMVEGAARK